MHSIDLQGQKIGPGLLGLMHGKRCITWIVLNISRMITDCQHARQMSALPLAWLTGSRLRTEKTPDVSRKQSSVQFDQGRNSVQSLHLKAFCLNTDTRNLNTFDQVSYQPGR